jgi:hypothetical protein
MQCADEPARSVAFPDETRSALDEQRHAGTADDDPPRALRRYAASSRSAAPRMVEFDAVSSKLPCIAASIAWSAAISM